MSEIIEHQIEKEISASYIDYAMSVIVSRALPDVRDGLKPVQRRIVYSMLESGITSSSKFRKCAAVVGDVLKSYHPHGDGSVYDALVRLAQPFSLRYPLIDGQGNFGSIDGDGAAAYRYTEAKLTKIAESMMEDIHSNTVVWRDNFDGEKQEPSVLPTRFPNALCNGTMGIAVGMATNMAPHNLREVIDAAKLLIKNETATVDDIMEIIKGPDFPTGGIIFDKQAIRNVYAKGKGPILVRGKYHLEDDNEKIVITEIPYQVNKANLVAKIGDLVGEKKIEGVSDITDESNRDGIRITIALRKGIDPNHIITKLFKFTDLQTNFNINNVTLTEGGMQPRLLNIKDILVEFVNFRREVVIKRSEFLLQKNKDRLHILDGLKRATDIIDEVIATIRASNSRADAKESLMTKFDFSDPQAEYILMMRLQTLVGLELQALVDEIQSKLEQIAYLESILNSPEKRDEVVVEEIDEIKNKFGDKRRTEVIEGGVGDIASQLKIIKKEEDKIKEDVILLISTNYETKVLYQSRINIIPDDVFDLKYTHNQDKLIVISETGQLVISRLKDLGQHTVKQKGVDFRKQFGIDTIVFVGATEEKFDSIIMLTNKNNIKKVTKDLLYSLSKFPTTIFGLDDDEKIIYATYVSATDNIGVLTDTGNMLLFPESQIRPTGKTAGGVRAMAIDDESTIVSGFRHQGEPFIFVYSHDSGKMLALEDLKIQKRAQTGLVATKLKGKEKVMGGLAIDDGGVKLLLTSGNVVHLHSNAIPLKTPYTLLDQIAIEDIERVFRPREERK